ncbi:11513_t:CDS:1, partial [Cetraspora pellucida]
ALDINLFLKSPIVADTSSVGKNVSSVNRSRREDFPTLELPIRRILRVAWYSSKACAIKTIMLFSK